MANGIYTNAELVDTLITDLNTLPRDLIDGQYIHACAIIAQMGQKLLNLRNGIKADLDGKDRVIEELKEQIRRMGADVEDCPPEVLLTVCLQEGEKNGKN